VTLQCVAISVATRTITRVESAYIPVKDALHPSPGEVHPSPGEKNEKLLPLMYYIIIIYSKSSENEHFNTIAQKTCYTCMFPFTSGS